MKSKKLEVRIGNCFMGWLLRSPLHGLMSGSTLMLSVRGRKSGKRIATAVNYLRQADRLIVTSRRERTWWRNLRGGSPVTLWLQGKEVHGTGMVIEDEAGVAAGLAEYLGRQPGLAKYFDVSLDAGGKPSAQDIAHEASRRVVVELRLENNGT